MNKIQVLIVEDEKIFANNFEQILNDLDPSIEVLAKICSVKATVSWLKENTADLIFLDIQLSDGVSFEIFEQISAEIPIIFLTSYDQYAIKAFKLNSVDYLLKPVNIDELKNALNKYKKLTFSSSTRIDYGQLFNLINNKTDGYKKRFMVHVGDKIKTIETDKIAYFFILERDTYLRDKEGSTYSVEFTLEKLEILLNPERFFRINRRYIINISSIKNMYTLSKSSIKVELTPKTEEETMISLSRTSDFKRWLNQ